MSKFLNTSFLDLSRGESLENERKAGVIEDKPGEPRRYKVSPRATLDALSGLRISRERVLIPETLDATAGGASASVQLAILLSPKEEHPEHPSAQGHFVALKQFRLDDDKGDREGLAPFAHELSLLRDLKHKHIVRGLGFVENVSQGIAWIVLPWAANGNLRDFVLSRSALWGRNISPRFGLMEDVACGLDYLHGQSEPICHGDLKSLNILVDEEQNAVITDFGSARILGEGWEARSEKNRRSYSTTEQQGPRVEFSISTGSITMTTPNYTVRWAAPEVLEGDLPTLASDVWSLGWICWEVLTGKFPFNDILKDQDVIIGVLGGEVPKPQAALAHSAEPGFSTLDTIHNLCRLMEVCWAMDPQSRPKCCHVMASLRDQFPGRSEHRAREEEVIGSLVFLQAVSERHLSEGRLGEAVQYIQEFLRVARLTKRKLAAITSKELLDRCRRSTSGVETMHEEEAGLSWNLAVTFFTGQLYQEAERHLINAARLYKELGFEAQALECDQFLGVIQDANGIGILPRRPGEAGSYNKDLAKLLLTHSERFRDPAPSVKDPTYECKRKRVEIVWFVAGALQCASPDPLSVQRIVSLIEEYRPGKIQQCQEAWDWSEKGTETGFTEYILYKFETFEADENFSGYWRLGELDFLPPFPRKDFLRGYFTPLGSPSSGGTVRTIREFWFGEMNPVKIQVASGLSKQRTKDEEILDSLVFLQAASEKHLSEGRLGQAIQYIHEFRRVARLTKRKLAAVVSQELLDRCRRSTSGIETVHEEEAGLSWNLALTFFAGQMYREAEKQVINAARLYKEVGFEAQALECDQFLDAIRDAIGTLLRYPEAAGYNKDLPKLLLTHPERFRDPVPSADDPIYESEKKRVEIVWIVAGALQCASPDPLAAERIVSLIEEYHPGKIQQCQEAWDWSKKGTDTEFVEYFLLKFEAFEAHETFRGYWRLSKPDYLPSFPRKNLLLKYITPLGSPEERYSGTLSELLHCSARRWGLVTFKTLRGSKYFSPRDEGFESD